MGEIFRNGIEFHNKRIKIKADNVCSKGINNQWNELDSDYKLKRPLYVYE